MNARCSTLTLIFFRDENICDEYCAGYLRLYGFCMGVDSAARVLHYSMKLYRDENLLQIGNRFLFFMVGRKGDAGTDKCNLCS